jgi:hypothetical protein
MNDVAKPSSFVELITDSVGKLEAMHVLALTWIVVLSGLWVRSSLAAGAMVDIPGSVVALIGTRMSGEAAQMLRRP